ncbi:MAG: HAMP domain-containing protein [Ignavibacteriae bacterium]|nr:HAMP domain-containing protein [Ignavibacteriota bacterium]
MKFKTLHTKFILTFTFIIACISAGLYIYLPEKLEEEAIVAIATQSKTVVEMAANSISPALFFSDKSAVEDEIMMIQKSPAIEFVIIRDNDGNVITSNGIDKDQLSEFFNNTKNANGVSSNGMLYYVSSPVIYDGAQYGILSLGISIQPIRSEIATAKQTITIILLMIFCVGFIVVYFLSSFITISLRTMVKTSERIASGDLSERVNIKTKDEIGQLATAFNRMVDNLQKALIKERDLRLLKSRFVNTISHEFRTPLTGISISTDILESYQDRLSTEQKIDEFHKIKERVSELTDLMNDFLMHSSVESMRDVFTVTGVDLVEIINRVIEETERISASESISMNVHFGNPIPIIEGDPKLLHHVVKNLVSNAIKYSLKGGEVIISLDVTEDSKFIKLSVRDYGIGIPSAEIDKLFTQFYRGSNTSEIPGTGLGLSIVKEFIELHNGSISVSSKTNEGTFFVVLLPIPTMKA